MVLLLHFWRNSSDLECSRHFVNAPSLVLEGLVLFEEYWIALKLKSAKANILNVESSQVHVWFF